jgi:hypothetical protein
MATDNNIFSQSLNKQVHKSEEKPLSLKQRILKEYSFSGKERKVCKKCGEVNSFFKNEC